MSKSDETRRRILDAARDLVETGAAVPTMSAIAERAGVSRQLLYVHFDGRADLVLELSRLVDRSARTPQLQARVDDAPDAPAALRELVAVQGAIKPALHGVVAVIDRLRDHDADAAAVWAERERARHGRCAAVTQRLAAEGVLADGWTPESAARVVWAATSQRAWVDLVVDSGWSTSAWVEHTTRLLERGLVAPPGCEANTPTLPT